MKILLGSVGSKSNRPAYLEKIHGLLGRHPRLADMLLWTQGTVRVAPLYAAADAYVMNAQVNRISYLILRVPLSSSPLYRTVKFWSSGSKIDANCYFSCNVLESRLRNLRRQVLIVSPPPLTDGMACRALEKHSEESLLRQWHLVYRYTFFRSFTTLSSNSAHISVLCKVDVLLAETDTFVS